MDEWTIWTILRGRVAKVDAIIQVNIVLSHFLKEVLYMPTDAALVKTVRFY